MYISFLKFEKSLWSRSSHRYLEILRFEKALWSWFSHSSFFSIHNQSALKIWKSSSWMTQKKHDLMTSLFVVFRIENLISYNLQLSIWWLTINCATKKSNSSSFLFFYSLCFLYRNRWVARKKENDSTRKTSNKRDRIRYIKFWNFLDFLFSSHIFIHNTQRSIRPDSSLWRCFWHDSALYAS